MLSASANYKVYLFNVVVVNCLVFSATLHAESVFVQSNYSGFVQTHYFFATEYTGLYAIINIEDNWIMYDHMF